MRNYHKVFKKLDCARGVSTLNINICALLSTRFYVFAHADNRPKFAVGFTQKCREVEMGWDLNPPYKGDITQSSPFLSAHAFFGRKM
jgi:hypothetical protein